MNRHAPRAIPLLWAALCLVMISCAGPKPTPGLGPQAALASRLRQQGDFEFAKMHWRGWKNAADRYQEALAGHDDPVLRQRLFTACILLSLREAELSFSEGGWLEKAGGLLPGLPPGPFASYLTLARGKALFIKLDRTPFVTQGMPELERSPVPIDRASALPHYLHLLFVRLVAAPGDVAKLIGEQDEFLRRHGHSNLAVFLRLWTPEEMDEKVAAFPDFAEMHKLRGDWNQNGGKYQAALADYQRAVEIMPVMFKARSAMATLFYSLEEYEQALRNYEQTLEIVPLDPAALFGRAICLSELRRYEESDQVLLLMIEKQSFYHGEANYTLAKNDYYRQRWADARRHLDQAAAYIPDSPEMNMLSGLLYLDQGEPGRAARDFRKVLEQEPQHAEAWYFLGQAALQEGGMREARDHFCSAIENFRRELAHFDAKLAKLQSEAGADPYQQNYYGKRLRQRRAYTRQALERLAPLRESFPHPPLPGLGDLLDALSAPPPGE